MTAFGLVGTATAAIWVGIDGDKLVDASASDLVQAGTSHDVLHTFRFGRFWTATAHHGWTEFIPQQPFSQVLPNFVVSPGDQIFVEVSILGSAGIADPAGTNARFILRNDTTNKIAQVDTPVGSTNVVASEAVWIVERPTDSSKNLIPLSNYGTITISEAQAQIGMDPDGTARLFDYTFGEDAGDATHNLFQITMTGSSGSATSTVAKDTFDSMTFTWAGAS